MSEIRTAWRMKFLFHFLYAPHALWKSQWMKFRCLSHHKQILHLFMYFVTAHLLAYCQVKVRWRWWCGIDCLALFEISQASNQTLFHFVLISALPLPLLVLCPLSLLPNHTHNVHCSHFLSQWKPKIFSTSYFILMLPLIVLFVKELM